MNRLVTIRPGDSAGKVRLGEAIEDVISRLGDDYEIFQRVPTSNRNFAFDSLDLSLEVDEGGNVIGISVFRPSQAKIKDIDILGQGLAVLHGLLNASGFDFEVVDAGLWDAKAMTMIVDRDGMADSVEIRNCLYS